MIRSSLVIALFAFAAAPALAQSSLGVAGADVGLSYGEASQSFTGSVDVALTAYHGLQLDVGYLWSANASRGTLAGHIYMTPQAGQKYGLFLSLTDLDGRADRYVLFGAEGLLDIGPRSVLGLAGGIGGSTFATYDTVYVTAELRHAFSDDTWLSSALTLAAWDEYHFHATTADLNIDLHHRLTGNVDVFAGLSVGGLMGPDAAPTQSDVHVGLRMVLGRTPLTPAIPQMFGHADPYAQLIDRGLVTLD
ncbi:MAG: hypothetical protein GC146_12485 [Limimaricola sp.]|uniref:hypothetical protein n=1 Tax=Limimaricola sp. TaxID=2211665 RepID=UPI001DA56988|nr:hypothetical protein [Limimaricola sp.]MBI1418031.1 hypothetical protein [Limimaricola sp.]